MPTLAIKPGAEDELPDGPASFDADDQGNLYIADPLRNRIAVFDSRGGYQRAVQNGFSADRIFIDATGTLMARNASSGAWQRISESGASPANPEGAEPVIGKLLSERSGTVPRRGRPDLPIEFDSPGARLASVRSLGTDSRGYTFVVLESGSGGDTDSVKKEVRLYSPDGALAARTSDLPLDYYIQPNDELRVRKSSLYQLMPQERSIHINVWKME